MSDTPRTDAQANLTGAGGPPTWHIHADFARQLERELAEAREDAMDHKRMLQSLSKTQALDRAELDRSFQHIMKQRDTLAKTLMRLHDAADAFAADQSESRDERCGLVQPVSVAECEELNQALKAAWELLNQPT